MFKEVVFEVAEKTVEKAVEKTIKYSLVGRIIKLEVIICRESTVNKTNCDLCDQNYSNIDGDEYFSTSFKIWNHLVQIS